MRFGFIIKSIFMKISVKSWDFCQVEGMILRLSLKPERTYILYLKENIFDI